MKPGKISPVSAGTLQGVYRPQARVYYHNARHGILFETLTKPLRCRSRKRAVELARDWIESAEFATEVVALKERILANPENSFAECAE